ncbi:uncharacterized protein LOC141602312 [Silene latifolia]|uniref:uncharacterized protein LOC141602312 n=1 Tax=Silene latifolia TaxID=37657 RepID=UPI003D779885
MDLAITEGNKDHYMRINEKVREFSKAAAIFWRQRSKLRWMVKGDTCTKYFFNWVKGRAGRNLILGIKDCDGTWIYEPERVGRMFHGTFVELFSTSYNATDEGELRITDELLRDMTKKVMNDDADELGHPFPTKEVQRAVFHMGALKSLGPDGYRAFYTRNVGEEFTWNEDFVRQLFSEESANIILAMPICRSRTMDEVYWTHTNKGPAMWKVLVWRIITDTLSIGNNFIQRNIDLDHSCKLYNHDGMVVETMEHLFRDCEVARRIWTCSELGIRTVVCSPIRLAKWIVNWIRYLDKMVDAESRLQDLVEDGPAWIRDSNLIHMIGVPHSCERIRIMVDVGWKSMDVAGIGWVALTGTRSKAFSTFSKALGLQMNASKSEVFFNGVTAQLKEDILAVSGFKEGSMPFRYLEIPMKAGRLNKADCNVLVEKVVQRIRGMGMRKLSYAGRITLIKSVFSTLHTYWAAIFILPKAVLKSINSLCRNYLWDGTAEYLRTPLVGWSKICLPKEEGGLGVKQIHKWNDAAEWETYEPGLDAAWYWKKICKMKTKFAAGFQNGNWILDDKGYSIKSGYEWSRNREPKCQWHKTVWSDWAIPKQSVITWLCMHKALNVRAKLKRIGYTDDDSCVLCGNGVETHDHLFFSVSTKL